MSDTEKKTSIQLKSCYPALPRTIRGMAQKMDWNTNKEGTWMAYPSHKYVVLRSLEDPSVARVYQGHKKTVNVVRFSPNGNYLCSGGDGGSVRIWSRNNFSLKIEVAVCERVLDIAWDKDGKRIVAAGKGDPVGRCFSWDTGNNIGSIQCHAKPVLSISMKMTRPFRFVTTCEGLKVNFSTCWPGKNLKPNSELHERYPVAKYSPDGAWVVSVGQDSQIYLFDGKTGDKKKRITKKAHSKSAVYNLCWSPDGKKFLTVGADRTAQIWDLETRKSETTYQFEKRGVFEMQMGCIWAKGKDGKEFIVTCSLDGSLNFLGADGAIEQRWQGHMDKPSGFVADPTNGAFFTCGRGPFAEGKVTRWDNNGVGTWFSKIKAKGFTSIALSCDQKILYSAEIGNAIKCNEVKSMEMASDSIKFKKAVLKIAAAKTVGDLFACITSDGKVHVLKAGKVLTSTDAGDPSILEFNNDDTILAVGATNGETTFYELDKKSGALTKKNAVKHHPGKKILCIKFKGDYISSSSDGSDCVVTKGPDGKKLNNSSWQYASASVNSHDWSPNGSLIATASDDGSTYVFTDTKDFGNDKFKEEGAHMDCCKYVGWLDNTSYVTVGDDAMIRLWGFE